MEIMALVLGLLFLGIVIGLFINVFWLGFGLILYFIPTVVAAYRKHPYILWIFLINLFFGWSIAGWIIPLLWAFDFDKVLTDFIEYRKTKNAKDAVIEGEVVKETPKEESPKEDSKEGENQ